MAAKKTASAEVPSGTASGTTGRSARNVMIGTNVEIEMIAIGAGLLLVVGAVLVAVILIACG